MTNLVKPLFGRVKNVSLENIKFPENSVVLIKSSTTTNTDSTIDTNIKWCAIPNVKDTKTINLVKHLLLYCLAEYKHKHQFEDKYRAVRDTNNEILFEESGIKAQKYVIPFLNTDTMYKTDSNGKLSFALQCEDGIKLNKTAFNIRQNHAITQANNANELKCCIHNQASAILAQTTYLTDIATMNEVLHKAIEEDKKSKEDKSK